MRTKSFLLFSILFFTVTLGFSQKEETVLGNPGLRFSGVWGGSNHQITRFGNTNSYMNGGFFGLEFGKAFQVGFSTYQLKENINWDNIANQDFEMYFRGMHMGYGLNNYKAVHPTFNIDLAPGRVKLDGEGSDRIFVVQPAAGIEINVLRWFHLGLQGGYRFVTDSSLPSLNDKDLSGAFGQVTLKFGWSWGRGKRNTNNLGTRKDKG